MLGLPAPGADYGDLGDGCGSLGLWALLVAPTQGGSAAGGQESHTFCSVCLGVCLKKIHKRYLIRMMVLSQIVWHLQVLRRNTFKGNSRLAVFRKKHL
ncbi:Serine/Arginine Repetitive Matrix Protein 2 [Manis pentadactyla]|nr:Serine/Arginine Repetitive Matrix Protein 2 [Manis pentadactyla]